MVRRKIMPYAMLMPERQYQIEQEIRARRAARIAVRLPSNSPEPKEEKEEQPEKEEGAKQQPAPMEEEQVDEEAEHPEKEMASASGFTMDQAEAEFAVAQADEMAEQQAIQDKAYVEANRRFIRQERAATDAFFAKLDAEMDSEADAEEPADEQPEQSERARR